MEVRLSVHKLGGRDAEKKGDGDGGRERRREGE
jgi:hypothetical protein